MPFNAELGMRYVTAPYHFGQNDRGCQVRVISVSDDTTISVVATGYEAVHDAGSFYHFDYPLSRQATPVYCSEPCLVVQYAKDAEEGGTPNNLFSFMLVLTPTEHFLTYAIFSTDSVGSDSDTDNALSLVVDFYPVDDLYLDGVNLEYLDWVMAAEGTGWYATMSIDPGFHTLYTTNTDNRSGTAQSSRPQIHSKGMKYN